MECFFLKKIKNILSRDDNVKVAKSRQVVDLEIRQVLDMEIRNAITNDDVEHVKSLLDQGANTLSIYGENMLNLARGVEVTKVLLSYGAPVNHSNKWGDNPLYMAVKESKGIEVVRELLKHGAKVDKKTDGDTPLNIAVRQKNNVSVIQTLVEHGADINMRRISPKFWMDLQTPLDCTLYSSEHANLISAKALIKMTVLKHFDKNYLKIISLHDYDFLPLYEKASDYLNRCVCEIIQMKTEEVKRKLTLYDFIFLKHSSSIALFISDADDKTRKIISITSRYPIYHDIILPKIERSFKRANLMKEVSGNTHIYTEIGASSENTIWKISLNYDSIFIIVNYLCNIDLLNLLIAFKEPLNKVGTFSKTSSIENSE